MPPVRVTGRDRQSLRAWTPDWTVAPATFHPNELARSQRRRGLIDLDWCEQRRRWLVRLTERGAVVLECVGTA